MSLPIPHDPLPFGPVIAIEALRIAATIQGSQISDILRNAKKIEEHILNIDERLDAHYRNQSSNSGTTTTSEVTPPVVFNQASLDGWFGKTNRVVLVGTISDYIPPDVPQEKGRVYLSYGDDSMPVLVEVPYTLCSNLESVVPQFSGIKVAMTVDLSVVPYQANPSITRNVCTFVSVDLHRS